jgi:hypothetical protein
MNFDSSEIYENEYDCEECVDFRKNLRCCREIVTLQETIQQLENRIVYLERKEK